MDTLEEYINESLANKSENKVPMPTDCKDLSVDAIVAYMTTAVNVVRDEGNFTNTIYYAGICKDVKDNMNRHCNDSYEALCDCGSRDKAGAVETRLGELGYDVGERPDNGGDEETPIVYIIKKARKFNR